MTLHPMLSKAVININLYVTLLAQEIGLRRFLEEKGAKAFTTSFDETGRYGNN